MHSDDDFDGFACLPRIRNMPLSKRESSGKKPKTKQKLPSNTEILQAQRDDLHEYPFSYAASRHESGWLVNSLSEFYETQWFDDILYMVKGGKEASVYLCQAASGAPTQEPYLAAKVYRPPRFRNMKDDHLYREGRPELNDDGTLLLDHGKQNAMQQRTDYGRVLLHTSWIEHEFKTMQILQAAGADVPYPYESNGNAILMSYIGDLSQPAPTLNQVDLSMREARHLFERLWHNIELMLANDCIHADLSAYNVLYWMGDITLIDFPQAVPPETNPNAFRIFERDVVRICDYFARQGYARDGRKLAAQLWRQHHLRRYPKFDLRMLDAEDPQDRRYWRMVSQEK